MYTNHEDETEKTIKKMDKLMFWGQIVQTLAMLGPSAWLLSGMAPESTQMLALLSIPTLIFIGYIWTDHFLQKKIMKLSREIDELTNEIDALK